MATECGGIVIGSPYSRRGTNQYASCEAPVRVEYLLSGKIYERDVCGIHVRQYRAMEKHNARMADVTVDGQRFVPGSVVTITPAAA